MDAGFVTRIYLWIHVVIFSLTVSFFLLYFTILIKIIKINSWRYI